MVGIFVVLEKRQLPGFDRVLGNGTMDHYKAVRALPVVGLITERSHLPPRAQLAEFAFRALLLIGACSLATTA